MAVDPRTAERVRKIAAELANGHSGDRSTRAAFLERAIEAVDRLTQTADDRGLREALDADTDAAVLSALGLTRNGVPVAYAAAPDPLAAAKARGEQAKRDILAAQGDMLSAADVAARLGCDIAEVDARRRQGLLIALPDEHGRHIFPSWQFTTNGLLPGLEDVLLALPELDPWSRITFLTYGDPYLDGDSPLTRIRRGDVELIRRLAAAYDELVAT